MVDAGGMTSGWASGDQIGHLQLLLPGLLRGNDFIAAASRRTGGDGRGKGGASISDRAANVRAGDRPGRDQQRERRSAAPCRTAVLGDQRQENFTVGGELVAADAGDARHLL